MKIAFVGKGGSGKSSVSWLAIKTLEDMGKRVLAVDADHNMDLTSNLGLDPERTPLMHKTDKEFMEATGMHDTAKVSGLLSLDEANLSTFSLFPQDAYTSSITAKVSDSVSLINVGLGSPDVMFAGKCAHGLSGPLKYYLGLLKEGDDFVVVDSVAGVDMLNYGLYSGVDAVIGVVEPHRNSVKVFEQIESLCRRSLLPCYFVVNKPAKNEFYDECVTKYKEKMLGEIPLDTGILSYDYASVKDETKGAMKEVLEKVSSFKKKGGLSSIKSFQNMKDQQ